MDEKNTLASEVLGMLKGQLLFYKVLVVVLLAALVGTNFYHIYQWSQFDTVVVDSGDGTGNANYVHGDNAGGIFNGTGSSETPEGWEIQGNAD